MAAPAPPLFVYIAYGLGVTPDTIRLQHIFRMVRRLYPFRHPAGIKNQHVLQAVYGFPDIKNRLVLIRQMAIDTLLAAMGPAVYPSVILRLHHMTSCAKGRFAALGEQPWRAKQKKQDDRAGGGKAAYQINLHAPPLL